MPVSPRAQWRRRLRPDNPNLLVGRLDTRQGPGARQSSLDHFFSLCLVSLISVADERDPSSIVLRPKVVVS